MLALLLAPTSALRSLALSSLALALLGAPALLPSPAHAQDEAVASSAETAASTAAAAVEERAATWQLVPAALLSYGGGATDNFGAGVSLRLDHLPMSGVRVGGFATAEVLADGTVRVAGGLGGGLWLFGMQLGVAYRAGTDAFASSLGLQVGKSIDFGGFSIGGRVTFPLVDFVDPNGGPSRTQGIEGQVVLTIGAALGLDGSTRHRSCGCAHRRPAAEAPAAIEEGVAESAPPS